MNTRPSALRPDHFKSAGEAEGRLRWESRLFRLPHEFDLGSGRPPGGLKRSDSAWSSIISLPRGGRVLPELLPELSSIRARVGLQANLAIEDHGRAAVDIVRPPLRYRWIVG